MQDIRTVEESYISAGNSSDLRVEADKKNVADVLIAAGWTKGILGHALMRLRSEWDGSAKPTRQSPEQILVTASKLPRTVEIEGVAVVRTDKELLALASQQADAWFMTELQLLRVRLKSLRTVHDQLKQWAVVHGAIHPERFAHNIVCYWLDSVCPACDGKGQGVIEGSPVLGHTCKTCHGTGKRREPMGDLGRQALSMMDECVMTARNSMRIRLRATHS